MKNRRLFFFIAFIAASLGALYLLAGRSADQSSSEQSHSDLVAAAQREVALRNYAAAYKLYETAARKGSSVAAFQLGAMNERGEGVSINLANAANWYQVAADRGSSAGANNLAIMYMDGRGVERSIEKADHWLIRAGELGRSSAFLLLGQSYWMGTDREADNAKAMHYFTRAAEMGNPPAMTALGIMFQFGKGLPKSNAHAFALFRLSSELNDQAAAENLANLKKLMTERELTDAEQYYKLARDGKLWAQLTEMQPNNREPPKNSPNASTNIR